MVLPFSLTLNKSSGIRILMMNDNSRTWFHIYSTLWSIIAQCLLCLFNTPFHHSLTIVLVPSYNIEWIAFMPTQFLRILFFSLYLHRFHSQNIKSTAQIAFDSLSLSSHNSFTFLRHPIPLFSITHYDSLLTLSYRSLCVTLLSHWYPSCNIIFATPNLSFTPNHAICFFL